MTERDWLGWFVKDVFSGGVNEGIERAKDVLRLGFDNNWVVQDIIDALDKVKKDGEISFFEETWFNQLAKEIHENAVSKGWWDQERNPLEIHALIHSEISEATECARNGEPDFHVDEGKPEGEAVELADAVIRILDYAAKRGWDFDAVVKAKMEYNKTRPHRHGGKLY